MTRTRLRIALLAAALPLATAAETDAPTAVSGDLAPLNAQGTGVTGNVTVAPRGDALVITLDAENAPRGMHLAHVHGFATADPDDAACPTPSDDTNGDGLVDLVEARAAAGRAIVPLNDAPEGLDTLGGVFPLVGGTDRIGYDATVPTAALRAALEERHGTPLALDRRVVLLHGVDRERSLPDSLRSLDDVPAWATLPIACAELVPTGR